MILDYRMTNGYFLPYTVKLTVILLLQIEYYKHEMHVTKSVTNVYATYPGPFRIG